METERPLQPTPTNHPPDHLSPDDVAARVRHNTASAAIAAALLLYFGFASGYVYPQAAGMFDAGGRIFIRTLQIGGCAMLLSAVASYTGLSLALLFDGVGSLLIGLSLAVSTLLMVADGGGGSILYGLFAAMFVIAGVRNIRDWAAFSRGLRPSPFSSALPVTREPFDQVSPPAQSPIPRGVASLTSVHAVVRTDIPNPASDIDDAIADAAPEGFLASFAPQKELNPKND
ncbi:MAG: hypothetical protein HOP29_02845 [Phycisphaerales bacterium]|nr:hypothetical protein [Phycisphaerales bacterium]